jgi:hypothetical protein
MPKHIHKALFLGIGFVLLVVYAIRGAHPLSFVDGRIYATAITDWLAGRDPYMPRVVGGTNFLYPPVVLLSGAALIKLTSFRILSAVYIILHLSSVLALPWIIHRYYLPGSSWSLPSFYFMFFFSPGLLGLAALDTGNISLICYASMLAASIQGIQKNNWIAFYIVTFACASIKITMLPMLLLPVFCGMGQVLPSLICAAGASICLQAQAWLLPDLFRNFKLLMTKQILAVGNTGKGIFGILFHIMHNRHGNVLIIPTAGYCMVAAGILLLLAGIRKRKANIGYPYWPGVVLASIFLIIPRVYYYDFCIGFPIVFCVFTETMRRRSVVALYLALQVPSIFFVVRFTFTALDGGFEVLALLTMLLLVVFRLYIGAPMEKKSEIPISTGERVRLV